MNEVQRSKIVLKILNKIYPKTPIPLKHRDKFTLSKAYPNPFNPSCTIKFQSSQSGDFAIKIYNLNGKLIHRRNGLYIENGKINFKLK